MPAFCRDFPFNNSKLAEVQVIRFFSGKLISYKRRFNQVLVTVISILFIPFRIASEISNRYGAVHKVPQYLPLIETDAILKHYQ